MNGKEHKVKFNIKVMAVIIATAGVLCFPQIMNLRGNDLGFTNSVFSVLIWILCIFMMGISLNNIDLCDKRGLKIAVVLSFLFTVAMLFGARLDAEGNVNFKDWKLWISIPALTCFFAIPIRRLWGILENHNKREDDMGSNMGRLRITEVIIKHESMTTYLVLLICWLPVFLAVYPGFFVYDAQDEYVQVAARAFSTHHPLVHVLMLGGIICAVHKFTGSYNLGIACYMVVQMLIMAGVFTYMINYLKKKKVSGIIRFLSVIYLSLFPVIVMYVMCSAKDTIFTAALLILLICMTQMCIDTESFFNSKAKMALFVLSAMIMTLFRKNALYAFIVMVPVLLIYFKGYLRKMAIIIAAVIISFFLIDTTLTLALHADDSEHQEILTVPIQQLTRTYRLNKEAFDEEDIITLHEILPEEALESYKPKCSDPVKYHFQNSAYESNKLKYIKLWAKIGLKKPLTYINAWLVNSYGLWYPDTVIDVYAGNTKFTFVYEDSSYFEYEVEEPGFRDSKIPWLDEAYRKLSLEIFKEKIPILSMIFSPGFLFWCYAFAFGYAVYRKKYRILIPYIMMFIIWLTMLLGPTYLVRYALIFWFALPLFAAILWEERRFI